MANVEIGAPSMRGVQNNLMSYGAGVISGLAYNLVSGFTGSGLIGGAISAAVAGSIANPPLGQMIAVKRRLQDGQRRYARSGPWQSGPGQQWARPGTATATPD